MIIYLCLMPAHMHAKCHYVSEDLQEASIPYESILPIIKESDYQGFIVTEYENEGHYDAPLIVDRNIYC